MTDLNLMGQAARAASRQLATLKTDRKNAALLAIAEEIEAQAPKSWRRTRSTSLTARRRA